MHWWCYYLSFDNLGVSFLSLPQPASSVCGPWMLLLCLVAFHPNSGVHHPGHCLALPPLHLECLFPKAAVWSHAYTSGHCCLHLLHCHGPEPHSQVLELRWYELSNSSGIIRIPVAAVYMNLGCGWIFVFFITWVSGASCSWSGFTNTNWVCYDVLIYEIRNSKTFLCSTHSYRVHMVTIGLICTLLIVKWTLDILLLGYCMYIVTDQKF